MILILSTESDKSTTEVQFWLGYYNLLSTRINDSDEILIDEIYLASAFFINKSKIHISGYDKGFSLDLNSINSYWYRRGEFNLIYDRLNSIDNADVVDTEKINKILWNEHRKINEYLNFCLHSTRSINAFKDNNINKLTVLSIAKQKGFIIPATLITTRKCDLSMFAKTSGELITKSIWNGDNFKVGNKIYEWPTLLFDYDSLKDEIPDQFPPTLFQKNIRKKYELRIFYFNENLYTSCIFSQRDPQTKIDFREYNRECPNRVVPYKMPLEITRQIIDLMTTLELKSGSIDMIYGEDNKYYFLEINPIGQFEQVSLPCNYYIERAIARYFKNNKDENYN